ncbi:MAG: Nif3-like dinuclear metal center hexameric protein [Candidatus Vesicomyosocius endoextente]|uniref:Nif3-like dinuclear metal center hexameric protein n=1 Tax=Candidatus Vesicomyosocius endoextente TaxID=2738853 RepID=A0A853G5U2_9GAMM|nr:Nif3-like dinuclear metal center hexameric protein [Candidatus Vesicomyosocius endoextente]
MIDNKILSEYCHDYLDVDTFDDYCPNGLQIEGRQQIRKIIAGVSVNQDLIEKVIDEKADALFVHHGLFWKNESLVITGIKKNRIKILLEENINLFAYHLPLDAHLIVGNNIQLAMRLNIVNPTPISDTLVWQGEVKLSLIEVSQVVQDITQRIPLVFGDINQQIKKIAWCTGDAQSYIKHAINVGADCFITGEISEQTPAIAKENNIAFISAGHYATERYGVQALCQHLSEKFNVQYQFIDIDNIV